MKKHLTPLLLIAITLFFVTNANAVLKRYRDPVTDKIVEVDVSLNATEEEISKALADKRENSPEALANKREKSIKNKCILKAGKMNNEFAAKKLYESCLADEGL